MQQLKLKYIIYFCNIYFWMWTCRNIIKSVLSDYKWYPRLRDMFRNVHFVRQYVIHLDDMSTCKDNPINLYRHKWFAKTPSSIYCIRTDLKIKNVD